MGVDGDNHFFFFFKYIYSVHIDAESQLVEDMTCIFYVVSTQVENCGLDLQTVLLSMCLYPI